MSGQPSEIILPLHQLLDGPTFRNIKVMTLARPRTQIDDLRLLVMLTFLDINLAISRQPRTQADDLRLLAVTFDICGCHVWFRCSKALKNNNLRTSFGQ